LLEAAADTALNRRFGSAACDYGRGLYRLGQDCEALEALIERGRKGVPAPLEAGHRLVVRDGLKPERCGPERETG
jgi:hypothetical protein